MSAARGQHCGTWLLALAALACLATAQAQLFAPQKDVKAYVWTNSTSPDFVWPELSDTDWGMPALLAKPSFGIGFSGGGNRANVLALGWTRALYKVRWFLLAWRVVRGAACRSLGARLSTRGHRDLGVGGSLRARMPSRPTT